MIQEIIAQVSFSKHTLTKKDSGVVEGDYNSTKLIFEFDEDVSAYRVAFEMNNPKGELVFAKDLVNNEVMLAGEDKDGNVCSLFSAPGLYPFLLVLYKDDFKLTSATGYLKVDKRQVVTEGGKVTEYYLPLFEELNLRCVEAISKANEVIEQCVDLANRMDSGIYANALKYEKSAWNYVSVDDFSPFDHEMKFLNYGGYFKDVEGKKYLAVFSKNFINYREAYKDFFTSSTSLMFSAAAKDLPAIKIPVPDELVNFPLRFSAKIKNSEEECCLRVYVSHADGTKQGGAKSTCSTTSYADSFIDFTAQKGDVLYLNYSKYGDSTVQVQKMMLTLQDLKDCDYEDFYFTRFYVKSVGSTNYVRKSEFQSESLVFIKPKATNTDTKLCCTYNKDISKAFVALQNAIISLGGEL